MKRLMTSFTAGLLMAPLGLAASAQEASQPPAGLTCAEYIELDSKGRTAAMEAMAIEIGMSAEDADEETTSIHLADLESKCQVSPELPALDAFMSALDNPG